LLELAAAAIPAASVLYGLAREPSGLALPRELDTKTP
jgi:hypothetical protein